MYNNENRKGGKQLVNPLNTNNTFNKMSTPEEEPLKKQKEQEKKTFKQKIINLKNNITVEPILAITEASTIILKMATQNLNLDKTCRSYMQYGDEMCDAIIARKGGDYKKQELTIQSLVSGMESWKSIIENALPCFLLLFIGAWSDKTGNRKLCIILPIFGELLMSLSNIVNYYYLYEVPLEMMMFFEAFFTSITGGWITLHMGAFAYLCDITSKESRTFRIGIATLCFTAGVPVGITLSGILLNKIGYYGVFSLTFLLNVTCIIYACYAVEERKGYSTIINQTQSTGKWLSLENFFDVKFVKETAVVAFKKGPNNRRIKSIMILATMMIVYGVIKGEFSVLYFFTRLCFDWDVLKFGYATSLYVLTHIGGTLFSLYLFSRRWQWDDSVLGLISMFSKMMYVIVIIFAKTETHMYIAIAVEAFDGTATSALRSLSSKLCSSDETGKMMSVFNLLEVTAKMVFAPIYMFIYSRTVAFNPKIMFYMSGVLTILAGAVFGWFFIQHKKELRKERKQCLTEENTNKEEVTREDHQLISNTDREFTKIVVKRA